MSDHHDCPGLFHCGDHPRWNVVYAAGRWAVYRPGGTLYDRYPTQAAAINYAQKEATK